MQNIYAIQSDIDILSGNLHAEGLSYTYTGFWFREPLSSPLMSHSSLWFILVSRFLSEGHKKDFKKGLL